MKLADYLLREGISNAEFARQSGLSEGTVSLLCRDESPWCKRDTAIRLVRTSNGAVTPNDLLGVDLLIAEAAQ
jgi:hypothetical protein